MDSAALVERLRPWLRETHAPAYDAALEWLLPRCRTEEERALAPALLLLLSPLNALVVPCRPAAGCSVNFQVTLSRAGAEGPERVRLTVRAGVSPDRLAVCLDPASVIQEPLTAAARVLAALLGKSDG